ncbi:alpha/beta fold hydrolase [Actinoplanes sp. N902-109]|uniref:alpha/beta fold hydrolase n=1 Tax=Actinoplanes sp. (strain N902-109) TaxID=649831 RepID=UPI0003294089|nr:alpha/beta hydrolase [Actinoplanes sp. N902-109]AGL17473.1 putative hydrolase or acyltransferase of alpha/beta superfamily [Actinoplanes sp. N902-109]
MPYVTTSTGVELYHEDFGTGDPVVLIHGWPLSGRSWENQIPALIADGKRVITYDRRGFGKSSQPWDGYDYDTFAADLDALLTQLDLTGVTLVGFSMGGGEVARYLGTYGSSRIAKAVFAAAVPPYLYKNGDNPDGALDDDTIKQFQDGITTDRIAFVDAFAENFFKAGKKSQVSDAQVRYAQELAHLASPKGTLDCVAAFGLTDFRDDLAKIDIPVLVIHGDSDAVVPFENSGKRTAEAIKGAQLHVIKDGPHGINASHPTEFNEALLAFLN